MSDTGKIIEQRVDALLAHYSIRFEVTGGARTAREQSAGHVWQCFEWRATFAKAGAPVQTFEYFTGIGHVTKPRHSYSEPRPTRPTAASVLYSLVLDSGAADQSFNDWCADFGEDNDSISAFNNYQLCCTVATKMRRVFTREQLSALRDALQDY